MFRVLLVSDCRSISNHQTNASVSKELGIMAKFRYFFSLFEKFAIQSTFAERPLAMNILFEVTNSGIFLLFVEWGF